MAGFPTHVFAGCGPVHLQQGDWTSDSQFLSALRTSWIQQYADYMGEEAAARHIEQLSAQGRLFAHHEPLTIHARIDERIVGISALRPLSGIDLITMLEVLPEFRNRGIGIQLVQALCSASKSLMAHVSIYQPGVKQFYRRAGFHLLDRAEVRHGEHVLEFDVVARHTVGAP